VLVHEKPSACVQVEINLVIPIKIIFIGWISKMPMRVSGVFRVTIRRYGARVLEQRIKFNLVVPTDSGATSDAGAFLKQAPPGHQLNP
jgi:hypothetical protein